MISFPASFFRQMALSGETYEFEDLNFLFEEEFEIKDAEEAAEGEEHLEHSEN
jgi:hypothetical protein